jgi:hypothetical protein
MKKKENLDFGCSSLGTYGRKLYWAYIGTTGLAVVRTNTKVKAAKLIGIPVDKINIHTLVDLDKGRELAVSEPEVVRCFSRQLSSLY